MLVPALLEFSLTPCDRMFNFYAPVCLAFSERPNTGRKVAWPIHWTLSTSRLRNQWANRLSMEVGGVSLWHLFASTMHSSSSDTVFRNEQRWRQSLLRYWSANQCRGIWCDTGPEDGATTNANVGFCTKCCKPEACKNRITLWANSR